MKEARRKQGRGRLKAPFPWFGGKARVADLVWDRFGNVPNYVEPFAGSLATLLKRPEDHRHGEDLYGIWPTETVNDLDGFISNFWRAVKDDPQAVIEHADSPVNENDLHARHAWLVSRRQKLTRKLEGDPDFYSAKIAGWWVWGVSCWIGSGFCSGKGGWTVENGELVPRKQLPKKWRTKDQVSVGRQRPDVGDAGKGVHRKRLAVGDKGIGVHKQRPKLGKLKDVSTGFDLPPLLAWFEELSDRLRRVRVCSGDWTRVLGYSPTTHMGLTGVFLDPPYELKTRRDVYSVDEAGIAEDVRAWALEHGDDPKMRIALCGYEGEHEMPDSWETVAWRGGGYGNQAKNNTRGKKNTYKERIWFSPHCLRPQDQDSGQEPSGLKSPWKLSG